MTDTINCSYQTQESGIMQFGEEENTQISFSCQKNYQNIQKNGIMEASNVERLGAKPSSLDTGQLGESNKRQVGEVENIQVPLTYQKTTKIV